MRTSVWVCSPSDMKRALLWPSARRKLTCLTLENVDQFKLATLGEILSGVPARTALDELLEIPFRPSWSWTGWMYLNAVLGRGLEVSARLPSSLVLALAELGDEALASAAQRWVETPELRLDRFSVEHARRVLVQLRQLAIRAGEEGKDVFLLVHAPFFLF